MSGEVMAAQAEAELQAALLGAMRADSGVQALLGTPSRLFDGETDGAAYPYAVLERHEVRASGSIGSAGQAHTFSFGVRSRFGGRHAAMDVVASLRAAVEQASPDLTHQRIILIQTIYSDVMRTPDLTAFRGVLRVRVITEEAG